MPNQEMNLSPPRFEFMSVDTDQADYLADCEGCKEQLGLARRLHAPFVVLWRPVLSFYVRWDIIMPSFYRIERRTAPADRFNGAFTIRDLLEV